MNLGKGVVPGDVGPVLEGGGGVGLIVEGAGVGHGVAVLVRDGHRGVAQGEIGGDGVGVGAQLLVFAGVVIEAAQEAGEVHGLVAAQLPGRKTGGLAILYIGVVGAKAGPVVVGAVVDVLAPVLHEGVIQGHGDDLVVHVAQNSVLGQLLVVKHRVGVQVVGQGDAGGQGDDHGVDVGGAGQVVRQRVDAGGVLLGGGVHVGVHLIARVPHTVDAAGLLHVALDLNAHQGVGLLLGGLLLLAALAGFTGFGVLGALRLAGGLHGGGVHRGGLGLAGDEVHHEQHQRQSQHRQGDCKAGAAAPAPITAGAHLVFSPMRAAAASLSALTHSTTQVPTVCSTALSSRCSSSGWYLAASSFCSAR